MITLCYIDVSKVVESKSIVQVSNYLDCIKNNKEPLAVIPSKAKALIDEEEKFKKIGYNLNYNEVLKNVASNHLALYRELNSRFQKLVATICLPHYNYNDFNLTSVSKILMGTNESWNSKFISRTIWSVHYHAVVYLRRKNTCNLQPTIEFDDHMLTLLQYAPKPIQSEPLKKAIMTAETGQQQPAIITKAERIKRTLKRFNRDDYKPVELYSENELIGICRHYHKKTLSSIKGHINQNDDIKRVNEISIQLEEKVSQSKRELQKCKY